MQSIAVGSLPVSVTMCTDGTQAYVANLSSNTVSIIDVATHTVVNTVDTGLGPYHIVAMPAPLP